MAQQRPFDPESVGARRLVELGLAMREWERKVAVTAHANVSFIDQEWPDRVDVIALKPGQRAEVPAAWANSLVARGAASYVR